MELFDNLALGFSTASTLYNLGFCLIGVLLGTLSGAWEQAASSNTVPSRNGFSSELIGPGRLRC